MWTSAGVARTWCARAQGGIRCVCRGNGFPGQLKDEALGLHLAQQLPIGALGPLDYALITSASVRMAMTRVARYYGVVTQRVRLTVEEDGEHARLVFTRKPGLVLSRHWLEFSFAVIANRLMTTVGGLAFLEVAHTHPPPQQSQAHAPYSGVTVRLEAGDNKKGLRVMVRF